MKLPCLAVIGVGALGSEVCRLLAENSFEHLIVIDPDRLEQRNVQLSFLYQHVFYLHGDNVFTQFKSELLVDAVREKYALKWDSFSSEIADVGLAQLAACNLVISCTDSALSRIETTLAARVLGLPILDGGVMSDGAESGRVSWFAPKLEAACYLCGISETRRAELLAYAASTSLGCHLPEEAPAMTGAPDTVQKTAAAMFQLIEKFSCDENFGSDSFTKRLSRNEAGVWVSQNLSLKKSITCPWHEEPESQWLAIDYDQPIRESLSERNVRLQMLWPHCIQARCRACGHRSSPNLRVALLRRKAVCTQCGTIGSSEPTEVINSIGSKDIAANFTPRQLGLPERHLYQFRRTFSPHATRKEVDEPVA